MLQHRASRGIACAGTLALTVLLGTVGIVSAAAVMSSSATHSSVRLSAESAVPILRNVAWVGYLSGPEGPRFRINSLSVGAPNPDAFQIAYANGSFTLEYEKAAGGPVTASYVMTLKGLVEWADLNANGQIDDGTVANVTWLGSAAFGARPIIHTEWTSGNGTVVHSFVIPSNSFPLSDTVSLSVNLTISQGFVTLPDNQVLTPMEAKLTIEFVQNLSVATNRVALQIGISTGNRVEFENDSWDEANHFRTDERSLNVTNASASVDSGAFFSWSNAASINGQAAAVIASLAANSTDGGDDLFLAYPNAPPTSFGTQVRIVHDPSIGVVSAAYASATQIPTPPSLQGDLSLYVLTTAAVAGIVAGSAYLVRRRTR